jgi:hypothetical protein
MIPVVRIKNPGSSRVPGLRDAAGPGYRARAIPVI